MHYCSTCKKHDKTYSHVVQIGLKLQKTKRKIKLQITYQLHEYFTFACLTWYPNLLDRHTEQT